MNDYIIYTDDLGQHFLSHSFGQRAHKYLLKIVKGAKTRYFYTQQEIQAYLKNQNVVNSTSLQTNVTANQRFTSRPRKVTGTATEIKKGEQVLNSPAGKGSAATNRVKTNAQQRSKEYTEAAKAVREYQFRKLETKRAAQGLRTATNIEDASASAVALGRAVKKQAKYGKQALKEIGDFASISLDSFTDDKKRDLKKTLDKVVDNTKSSTIDSRRKIYRKPDGTYVVVYEGPKSTYAEPANNKNATLLGSKEARKDYKKAKEDIRYLERQLKSLRKEDQTVESVATNTEVTEKALKRAKNHLKVAKENYDRTRTIDEIPDYIYTKGLEAINKYTKRRG